MAPPPPRMSDLLEELVAEVFLRVPPTNAADLLRASLVCKRWCRILSDPAFRRLYCHFHRESPLLGFFNMEYNTEDGGCNPTFVPSVASPCSLPALDCDEWWALDCRHGRVVIYSETQTDADLVVWDPITHEKKRLPLPPISFMICTVTVLCAVAGCNHLHCHGGPFLVVFLSAGEDGLTWASVYSSETVSWGDCCSVSVGSYIKRWPSLLIGDVLYFMLNHPVRILRHDLARRYLSLIDAPIDDAPEYEESNWEHIVGTVMMIEGGRLGFAGLDNYHLHLWSWQEAAAADGAAGWKPYKVFELVTLLWSPVGQFSVHIVGFMEGTDAIFLSTDRGIFSLKVKLGVLIKVGEPGPYLGVFPYFGFCTPQLERFGLK